MTSAAGRRQKPPTVQNAAETESPGVHGFFFESRQKIRRATSNGKIGGPVGGAIGARDLKGAANNSEEQYKQRSGVGAEKTVLPRWRACAAGRENANRSQPEPLQRARARLIRNCERDHRQHAMGSPR